MTVTIKDRREEWRKDGEATAYGTPYDKWLAAAYPAEYMALFHPQSVPDTIDAEQAAKQERKQLRDEFAKAALQGLVGISSSSGEPYGGEENHRAWIAAEAYALADAMLAEREKGGAQ
jgi:hypothetical protein